jgi:hypothetical protein
METKAVDTKDAAPAKPTAPESAKKEKPAKTKKGGCLKGCLLFLLVLLLLVGAIVANALGLPQKLGLVKSATEKRYDVQAADRVAAADLVAELETKGVATKGMEVYVLPLKDGSGSGAYVVLDQSNGFAFAPSEGGDAFLGTLASLAKSEAVKANGIKDVAFEYRDAKGRSLITIGAKVQDGADFADGKITEGEFMAKVGGKADMQNITAAINEILQ